MADPAAARSASLTLATLPFASVKEVPERRNPLAGLIREESAATNSTVPDWTIPTVPSEEARTKTWLVGALEGAGVLVVLGLEGAGPLDITAVLVGRSV